MNDASHILVVELQVITAPFPPLWIVLNEVPEIVIGTALSALMKELLVILTELTDPAILR